MATSEQHPRRRDRSQRQRDGDNLGCHPLAENWTPLPNALFGMPAGAIAVWAVIKSHAFGADYFLSYEQIGREAGMSRSSAKTWAAWLIARGLVKIEKRGDPREGHGNVYSVAEPELKTGQDAPSIGHRKGTDTPSTPGNGYPTPQVTATPPPGNGYPTPPGNGYPRRKKHPSGKEEARTESSRRSTAPQRNHVVSSSAPEAKASTASLRDMAETLAANRSAFGASCKTWLDHGKPLTEKQQATLRKIYAEKFAEA